MPQVLMWKDEGEGGPLWVEEITEEELTGRKPYAPTLYPIDGDLSDEVEINEKWVSYEEAKCRAKREDLPLWTF